MPVALNPTEARLPESEFLSGMGLSDLDFGYTYPKGLSLKPGSEFHEKLREKIWARLWDSRRAISPRYESWREIDATLKAYTIPKDRTKHLKAPHSAPVPINRVNTTDDPLEKIVMPVTFANMETLLTYMASAFLQDPVFTYEGTGPEDAYGAFLLTQHIAHQCYKSKVGLALHTQWRDAFTYGFGIVAPMWHRQWGTRIKAQEQGFFSPLRNLFTVTNRKRSTEKAVLWEGNELVNIDPYRYFPDPATSVHEPQKAEYHGWLDESNYMELLHDEKDPDSFFFNVRYLRHLKHTRSSFAEIFREGRDDTFFLRDTSGHNQPVDLIFMYITIIPEEWDLGSGKNPEKWFFVIGGDQVILAAQPLGLHHDMYPLAIAAPDYDGYSPFPTSRLEITMGLQRIVDFLYSSHIANVRKAINDMIVVDPSIINIYDLNTSKPGKIIRTRRSSWGRGGVDAAIKQLKIEDITANHVTDFAFLDQFMKRVLGADDNLAGIIPQRSGERISASEAQGARTSGLARLERLAKIISMQSMQDVAYQFAVNTQQFADKERYLRFLGDWPQQLSETFGVQPDGDRVLTDPMDMLVDFDLKAIDGTIPGSENAQTWIDVLQVAAQSPEMLQTLNLPNIFLHIARHLGAKNISDFVNKAASASPVVAPDQQVSEEAQAGNLEPLQL